MEKLISVVIPAYNRAATLSRAINSALRQTYHNVEVIIVDDASKDTTEEVVKSYTDKRIIFLRHPHNKGGGAARNTGINAARGEFVAFLDSDDEWMPKKLEKQIPLFQDDRVGFVYCGYHAINEQGRVTCVRLPEKRGDIFKDLLVENCIGSTSQLLVRKKLLEQIGGFDPDLPCCQDWDLCIRLSKLAQADFVREYLFKYHTTPCAYRIYNNSAKVLIGHRKVQQKYKNELCSIPPKTRARHFAYTADMFTLVERRPAAAAEYVKAFCISRDPGYLLKACRKMAGHFLRRASAMRNVRQ